MYIRHNIHLVSFINYHGTGIIYPRFLDGFILMKVLPQCSYCVGDFLVSQQLEVMIPLVYIDKLLFIKSTV